MDILPPSSCESSIYASSNVSIFYIIEVNLIETIVFSR